MQVAYATNAAIEFSAVTIRRGSKNLVGNICVTIPRGTHWSVLGPNGAGKSTILKFAGAKCYPTTGTVKILGRELGHTSVHDLHTRIGYVDPQAQLDNLEVSELVLSGVSASNGYIQRFEYTEEHRQRTAELLTLVGMDTRAHRKWQEMSHGDDYPSH